MSRIVVVNPNSNLACSREIDAALAPYRFADGPAIDVMTLREGPPAIYDWSDWFAVAAPLRCFVERERADCFVVACASDPGLAGLCQATPTPVLGIFSCAVLAALARAERFGVIAIVDASKARHLLALRTLGVETRLASEIALNVSMDTLLDAGATRAAMQRAGRDLVADGAGAVVMGCAGMAHHRAAVEDACGVPVIEPCQAGVVAALGVVLQARTQTERAAA